MCGIARHLTDTERGDSKLYAKYGDWSWQRTPAYKGVRSLTFDKANQEEKESSETRTVEDGESSMTANSFFRLIARVLALAQDVMYCNLLEFIILNQEAAILILIYFGGLRALEEIANFCVAWIKVHNECLIEVQYHGQRKNKKLCESTLAFHFSYSSFIMGEKYCAPIILLLKHRKGIQSNRLFLYPLQKNSLNDECWFAERPVGPQSTLIRDALNKHAQKMVIDGMLLPGNYTNKSLRNTSCDRLEQAGVCERIAATAIHHINNSKKEAAEYKNLQTYSKGVKDIVTRQKIAYLLAEPGSYWSEIEDTDNFLFEFQQMVPRSCYVKESDVVPEFPVAVDSDLKCAAPCMIPPSQTTPSPMTSKKRSLLPLPPAPSQKKCSPQEIEAKRQKALMLKAKSHFVPQPHEQIAPTQQAPPQFDENYIMKQLKDFQGKIEVTINVNHYHNYTAPQCFPYQQLPQQFVPYQQLVPPKQVSSQQFVPPQQFVSQQFVASQLAPEQKFASDKTENPYYKAVEIKKV